MSTSTPPDESSPLIDPVMMDLFRIEVETQSQILNSGLLEIEHQGELYKDFEPLMRAAHSLKGAGRIVHMEPLIHLSHTIEDIFVAAQEGFLITSDLVETLLHANDQLLQLAKISPAMMPAWVDQQQSEWEKICEQLQRGLQERSQGSTADHIPEKPAAPVKKIAPTPSSKKAVGTQVQSRIEDRMLRVTAQNLNRLMGLAGEAMVESRWLEPFAESLFTTKNIHNKLADFLDMFRMAIGQKESEEKLLYYLEEACRLADECNISLTERLADLDQFIVRNSQLSTRLYGEVIDSRMRPFADCLEGFPRMVRDLAKELNKKVRLEVIGKDTLVDRDILEKLEAPLGHILRNAVDHGIEHQPERVALGKQPEGKIVLEAQHRAGMLHITISDDGRGIDVDSLRKHIVEKGLAKPDIVQKLSEQEVLEFLMLPGFSTAKEVTDISGRGVGLNVVQNMVQQVSGSIRIQQKPGKGTTFILQLPLTLSVIRALIVEVSGDPYAFPLARIDRVLEVSKDLIESIEGRQYFSFEDQNIGLIPAAQVLDLKPPHSQETLSVVVFSDRHNAYGIVVDALMGEKEFVVHELDSRLKKIPDVYAAALMEDGSPIIILDVEDMVRNIDRLLTTGRLHNIQYSAEKITLTHKKRILVVDDSITVREVEARLLRNYGYDVEMAINGMDGWNAVRVGKYDLVVTDIDMPRMNGIELIRAIRNDNRLKLLPIMIVSYKEREEDRLLGMEAGANYYLAKSNFHDETLLNAVIDLIGT